MAKEGFDFYATMWQNLFVLFAFPNAACNTHLIISVYPHAKLKLQTGI